MKTKYNISYCDLGVPFQDSGAFRSYELSASGDSLGELIEDATISEIDQDGGELNTYGYAECSTNVLSAVDYQISKLVQGD